MNKRYISFESEIYEIVSSSVREDLPQRYLFEKYIIIDVKNSYKFKYGNRILYDIVCLFIIKYIKNIIVESYKDDKYLLYFKTIDKICEKIHDGMYYIFG